MQNFFDHLQAVLKRDARFFSADGNFLRNKTVEAATLTDKNLLRLLLDDDITRAEFFTDVDAVKIFNAEKFKHLITRHEFFPDSYTRFSQNIGLVDANENFIARTNKIALVFPYKDCVIEGGQTSDAQKRNEIFYNVTLAPDDVDRLLEPKVFSRAQRFTAEGAAPAENFSDNDNLIVKGNNLIALASLIKRFRAKVKCIYIDPPYNTGSDTFGYNDRFNHSAWLTFMKNRLELAKDFLADDGSIWISIDDDEGHYLKVLCDEIFGRDNFVATVIWEKKYSPQNDATWLSDSHDFILVYAKNKNIWRPNLLPRTEEMDARYKNPDNDPRGVWKAADLTSKTKAAGHSYCIKTPSGRECYPPDGRQWAPAYETFLQWREDNRIWFGVDGNNVPALKIFLSEVQGGSVCKTIWTRDDVGDNQDAIREMRAFGFGFETPKPERLLERILTLATNAGELVMDFFVGSGTTAAVAHKMGRRYIGVEQMNYIETLTVERLKKVIGGEQGGISKRVNWTGGGSFVYCELAELNQKFFDAIERATVEDLPELYEEIAASRYISCKVSPAQMNSCAAEFAELTAAEQKRLLLELLDKNLLYVNLCDMDDADFAICAADKIFTRSFYGEEG